MAPTTHTETHPLVFGQEVSFGSIAGPTDFIDVFVDANAAKNAIVEWRVYATVGSLVSRVGTSPGGGSVASVLKWSGPQGPYSPLAANGSSYELRAYWAQPGPVPTLKASIVGYDEFDTVADSDASASEQIPASFAEVEFATANGYSQFADVAVTQQFTGNVNFTLYALAEAGGVEAAVASQPLQNPNDSTTRIFSNLKLPGATSYSLRANNVSSVGVGPIIAASLACYSIALAGAAVVTLAGDDHGPSNDNRIHNFQEIGITTPQFWGAIGDGVTDDTAAFTAMFAALAASVTIGVGYNAVDLGSNKTYLTTGNFEVPANTFILGRGFSTVMKTVTNAPIFMVGGAGCGFENFRMLGTGSADPAQHGIQNGIASTPGSGFGTTYTYNLIGDTLGGAAVYVSNQDTTAVGDHTGMMNANLSAYECGYGLQVDTLAEYVTLTNCRFSECGIGLWINAGNFSAACGTITDAGTGVRLESGVNGAHGIISAVEINHCSNSLVVDATSNPFTFSACTFFFGDLALVNNTGVITFSVCTIDQGNYYFEGSIARFVGCTLPGSDTNAVHNSYASDPSTTQWLDCVDLNGLPSKIASSQVDGTLLGSKPQIASQRGVAANGGGTFVAVLTPGTDVPLVGALRLKAIVGGVNTAAATDILGLSAEGVFFLDGTGTTTLPTNTTGSANPATIGIQIAQAATAGFDAVTTPAVALSVGPGGVIRATVTNPGAQNATVQVDWEAQFVAA